MWLVKALASSVIGWLLKRFLPSREIEQGYDKAENVGLKANVQQVKKASAAVDAVRADSTKLERLRDRFRKTK